MSMNHVILVGRLGAEPEVRSTQSGKAMCRLRLATDGTRREGEEATPDWHDVVVWERQAEICGRYLAKGRQIGVEGRIRSYSYTDKQGQRRWKTEIVARRVTFLGGRDRPVDGAAPSGGGPSPVARPPSVAAGPLPF